MDGGPITLYDSALYGMLACTQPGLVSPITAVLLSAAHVPDMAEHTQFSHIKAEEIAGYDYARKQVTGQALSLVDGSVRFTSDTIQFGNPVTIGPVKYLALVFGSAGTLADSSVLLGLADLAPSSGAVESQNSGFAITPPAEGWFSLS